MKKYFIIILCSIIIGFILGIEAFNYVNTHFIYNRTSSLPQRIFKISGRADNHNLIKGDYVSICPIKRKIKPLIDHNLLPKNGYCYNGYNSLLKIVGAIEGDYVVVDENGITVNGSLIYGTVAKSKNAEHFKFKGYVPKDHIIVYTHHEKGFDSRYFGFISADELVYLLDPVF